MTLGDSGSYFNLWLKLVSSDGGLAVSGSKKVVIFLINSSRNSLGTVTRRQSTGEVHSCSWQVIRHHSYFCPTCRGQAMAARCALRPSDLGYLEDCGHDQEFRPITFGMPPPTPKADSSKGQPALQKDSKPTDTYPSYF